MLSKAVVLVVACFLLVILILSLYSIPKASALLNKATSCTPVKGNFVEKQILCCQTISDTGGAVVKVTCTLCDDTEPPSNCGPPFNPAVYRQGGQTGAINPPSTGTLLPPSGNHTGTVTNGPPRLGTVLPPSGNNTGTPGKTSIFNPIRNTTNALSGNNNTGTLPPGSIIKVPPGTVGSATNPSNTTGTSPTLSITKEHNPASPNVLSLAGNTTNPSNNTSTLKSTPITGQNLQTSGGHHHHKGSTSTSTGSNSTGH
jgi:hypothetical protein